MDTDYDPTDRPTLESTGLTGFRLALLEDPVPGDPRHLELELRSPGETSGPVVLDADELDALVALLKELIG